MTGDDLRKLRERRGLTREELAASINSALGKQYNSETIARWERGRPINKAVQAFAETLAVSEMLPPLDGGRNDDEPAGGEWDASRGRDTSGDNDSAPGSGAPPPTQLPVLTGGSAWTKACEELWEMIATGVGMIGAVTDNPALVNDGAIIAGDKQALGAAWGKLAETNETLRKMLVGMTEGGAWLQVALVTGTTVSKCWQGHAAYAANAAATANGRTDEHLADAA